MEEKKLTDEVVVEKNAITDEEIAKAILQSIEYSKTITYFDEWGNCKSIFVKDILDLIHRLKKENEELKSPKFASWKLKFFNLKEEFDKELAEHEEFTKEAKAEIERLTELAELRLRDNQDTCKLLDEKEKQVDELKAENTELYKEHTTLIAGSILQKKQAVKDTAKEISKKVVDLNVIYGDDFRLFLDNFELWVKERYGVSYEENN